MARTSNVSAPLGRRQIVSGLAAAGMLGVASAARAQAPWRPPGPVRIVIPFPPGGTADILARFIAPMMSERLGQPFVVENRPGATGAVASAYFNTAPNNGTVLLMGITDSLSIWPNISSANQTDVTKFLPVAALGTSGFALLGRSDLPAATLQEFVALLRRGGLRYASAGIGSGPHMMTVAMARAANAGELLHVPYPGMAPALQALLGKQIDFMLVAVGGATQYRSTLKFFGVTSGSRVAAIADVPTLTEQGLALIGEAWFGVLAPPATPAPAVNALAAIFNEVTASADYTGKLRDLGVSPLRLSREEFARYYTAEYTKWGELVRAANIRVD